MNIKTKSTTKKERILAEVNQWLESMTPEDAAQAIKFVEENAAKSINSRRIMELLLLGDGWYDGEQGKAIAREPAKLIGKKADKYLKSPAYLQPAIFPTLAGNIQLEWSIGDYEVILSINLKNLLSKFDALNVQTNEQLMESLGLNSDKSWVKLRKLLIEVNKKSK